MPPEDLDAESVLAGLKARAAGGSAVAEPDKKREEEEAAVEAATDRDSADVEARADSRVEEDPIIKALRERANGGRKDPEPAPTETQAQRDGRLIDAIITGKNEAQILAIINEGAALNATRDGDPAVIWAARSGNVEGLIGLIGADFADVYSIEKRSLMTEAAYHGHLNVVEFVDRRLPGLDINAPDKNGETARQVAERRGHANILEYFSKQPDRSLGTAVENNNYERVATLLEQGANPKSIEKDVLCRAVNLRSLDALKIILKPEYGVDVNAPTAEGETALGSAVRREEHLDVLELLLESGADANAKVHPNDTEGFTPLGYAAGSGRADYVKALLEHGADPALKDRNENTALDYAKNAGHTETVAILEAQLDLTKTQKQKNADLIAAIKNGKGGNDIKALIDDGAEVNADNGMPGRQAAIVNNASAINVLTDQGADFISRGSANFNAMTAASYYGSEEAVNALRENGVSIKAEDGNGKTALMIAEERVAAEKLPAEFVEFIKEKVAEEEAAVASDTSKTQEQKNEELVAAIKAGKGGDDIKALIDDGADVNGQNEEGITPIVAASHENNIDALEVLVKQEGIELNARDGRGYLAAVMALYKGENQEETLKILLDNGADPYIEHKDGYNVPKYAKGNSDAEVLKFLEERGIIEPEIEVEEPAPGSEPEPPAPPPNPPYGIHLGIVGKPHLVRSPFSEPNSGQLVDVGGKSPGSQVLCPFTGKPFLVPEGVEPKPKSEEPTPPPPPARNSSAAFDWDRAQVGGNLALLKWGTGHQEAVKLWQESLNKLGANLEVDGIFGIQTYRATESLQLAGRKAGLKISVDGKAYVQTFGLADAMLDNNINLADLKNIKKGSTDSAGLNEKYNQSKTAALSFASVTTSDLDNQTMVAQSSADPLEAVSEKLKAEMKEDKGQSSVPATATVAGLPDLSNIDKTA